MCVIQYLRPLIAAAVLLLPAAGPLAQNQTAQKEYEPQPYQAGKDVVWLPTPQSLVDKMLDMGKVTPNDFVIDLGSGDGITVIAAAKRGARALGIEYNPDMVELSTRNAEKAGVSARAKFIKADLFETDFGKATVVTMYLLQELNLKLRPKIYALRPGTRVVSHAFDMGEWKPDRTQTVDNRTAFLWIVPAKVAGVWRLPQGELTLRQEFQMIEGTLKRGDRAVPVSGGRLRGSQIRFNAGGGEYRGKVVGDTIKGSVKRGDNQSTWHATRHPVNPDAALK